MNEGVNGTDPHREGGMFCGRTGCARDQILWYKEPKTGVGAGTVNKIQDTGLTPVVFSWSRGRRKMESIDSTENWSRKRNKETKNKKGYRQWSVLQHSSGYTTDALELVYGRT